jgi:hypothetical protein
VVTGQDVAVYDRSGKVLKTQNMRDFIAAADLAPGEVNYPRAIYDPFIGRWISRQIVPAEAKWRQFHPSVTSFCGRKRSRCFPES